MLQDSVKRISVSSTQIIQSSLLTNDIGLFCEMHVLIEMELILGRSFLLSKMDSDSLATGPPPVFSFAKRKAPP